MTTKRIFLTFLQSDEKFDNLLSFFPKLIESLTTTAILEVASNANIAVEENWLSVMEKYTKSHHKNMKSVCVGKLNEFVGELLSFHLFIFFSFVRKTNGLLIT